MAASFSDFGTPAIDGQAVSRVMPMMVLRNAVQGMQQVSGRGVTEEFTTDTEATEIRVIRQTPISSNVRNIGGIVNGAFFNADSAEESASDFYGLRILTVYDTNFDIAEVAENMFKPSILDATVINMAQFIAKNVNASTMAEQIAKALNVAIGQVAGAPAKTNFVDMDVTDTTGGVLDSLLDGYAILDNGDDTNGIDTFTYEGRCVLLRSSAKRALPKGVAGTLTAGNFKAQNMLKVGGADPDTMPNNLEDGFFGEIDSTPHYMTSKQVWDLAGAYLVNTADNKALTSTLDSIVGILTHKTGTLRGMAFAKAMKIIDNPRGQGKRIQPLYRWGHETIFPKSVVLYGDETAFLTLVDTTLDGITVGVVPPGSQTPA